MATESKLWQAVNALGSVRSENEIDRAVNDTIRQVLDLIEADEAAREEVAAECLAAVSRAFEAAA